MNSLVVGVDAGGTSTRAVVLDGASPVARADGTGTVMRIGKGMATAAAVAETVRRALAAAGKLRAGTIVVGVAGAGREAEREELRQALRGETLADRVIVTGDTELALAAAFGSSVGILLTAGTGSMAVARDPAGTIHRAGGLGWQMGDEGSGYSIGRAGLVAVGRASDGRGPATSLGGRVAAVVRAESIEGLVRWAATAGTAEVAALAQTVLQVAKEGDPVAGAIVTHAAEELCGLVSRLLGQFGPDTRHPVAAAMNGGLLLPGSMLRDAVMERLRRNPRLELREAPLEAALGAVELAAQAAG